MVVSLNSRLESNKEEKSTCLRRAGESLLSWTRSMPPFPPVWTRPRTRAVIIWLPSQSSVTCAGCGTVVLCEPVWSSVRDCSHFGHYATVRGRDRTIARSKEKGVSPLLMQRSIKTIFIHILSMAGASNRNIAGIARRK